MPFFRTANAIIASIDEFFDAIEQGVLVFKQGIYNYIDASNDAFSSNLESISEYESKADDLRRKVENELYIYSLLPQFRGDVLRLLERTDDLLNLSKTNLYEFDIEQPHIPPQIKNELKKLTEIVVSSIETLIPACRAYFKDVNTVKDKIHKVYFYEREADKIAMSIKRKVFQGIPGIKRLSEKTQIRHFVEHIERLSDVAEDVADILSILAIKRIV